MSPFAANSLISDLVEMAKASEELPKFMEALEIERKMNDTKTDTIQRLELKLLDRNAEIEALQTKVHEVEVARDDAELRFLEVEDRARKALEFMAQADRAIGAVKALIEGPKAQPEPMLQAAKESEDSPLPDASISSGSQSLAGGVAETLLSPQLGQSDPNPTPASDTVQPKPSSESATSNGAESTTDATPEPSLGPYFGKRYIDIPFWVSREDWLVGGGTEADYDYRPPSAPF